MLRFGKTTPSSSSSSLPACGTAGTGTVWEVNSVDSIRAYHVGPDAGVNPGKNYDFAVVADFDDADGYLAYRDHPAHRAVVENYVEPIVARRAYVQYEL